MKITKSQLKRIIKEEINNILEADLDSDSAESQDPLVKVLELLEDILYEVQIDAGAYDEHKRSFRSGREEVDKIKAQTASEYIPELNAAIELLKSIIEKPAGAGLDLDGFEIKKIRTGYLIVDKESGEAVLGPFQSEDEAIESLGSIERNPDYRP